jgi:hypothetical protein
VVYIRGELEQDVGIGDSFRALTDAPGQTATNWDILESNGYVGKQREQINIRFALFIRTFPTVKSVYDFVCQHLEKKFLSFGDITGTTHIRGGI